MELVARGWGCGLGRYLVCVYVHGYGIRDVIVVVVIVLPVVFYKVSKTCPTA